MSWQWYMCFRSHADTNDLYRSLSNMSRYNTIICAGSTTGRVPCRYLFRHNTVYVLLSRGWAKGRKRKKKKKKGTPTVCLYNCASLKPASLNFTMQPNLPHRSDNCQRIERCHRLWKFEFAFDLMKSGRNASFLPFFSAKINFFPFHVRQWDECNENIILDGQIGWNVFAYFSFSYSFHSLLIY